jgi:hypothetical protein
MTLELAQWMARAVASHASGCEMDCKEAGGGNRHGKAWIRTATSSRRSTTRGAGGVRGRNNQGIG